MITYLFLVTVVPRFGCLSSAFFDRLNERKILGRIDEDLSLVLLDEERCVEHVFNRLPKAFRVDNEPDRVLK